MNLQNKIMKWKLPPKIKIYEAIGAVADNRIEINCDLAKVYSSSGNKFYDVVYDSNKNQIMTNDNGSYWKGYLGYPAIAFLMKNKVLSYSREAGDLLKGVKWKDINQKFKNDFDKTLNYILINKSESEVVLLKEFVEKVESEIKKLNIGMLGKKILPPDGY